METAAGFIVIVLILAIIAGGSYFAYDYVKYKRDIEDQLGTTQKNVSASQTALADEQKKRLSNMKYVVDQINTTNEDIFNTFTSNVTDTRKTSDDINNRQANLIKSLENVMRFKTVGAISSNIDLLSLPGAPQTNMELMRRVNTVNGMDFNELNGLSNVKFCGIGGGGAAGRCIKLPDSNGDTVLTNLVPSANLVMDSDVYFSSNLNFRHPNGATLDGLSSSRPLTIRSNKFVQIGNQLNLGDTADAQAATAPSSYLSIKTENTPTTSTKKALQISTPTAADVLTVDNSGKLNFNNRHSIYQNNANGNKLQVDAQDGIVIQATGTTPSVTITASTITLTGDINVGGTLKVGGKAVQTVP